MAKKQYRRREACHCVFAITGGKSSIDYRFKKISRFSPYPNTFLIEGSIEHYILLTCMSQLEL